MEDVVALGGLLLVLLKHADRVEIACLSEICNCISHIRTRTGGGVWVLPPYYAYLHFTKYGRGTSLVTQIDSPKYDSADFTDVPFVDTAAVLADNGEITVFAINRSLEDSLPLELEFRGFDEYIMAEHIVVNSEDPLDTNTEDHPDKVKPRREKPAAIEGNRTTLMLPKLSWNVLRFQRVRGQ
jgi:alpha-N-arabinofuranosidase